MEQINEWNKLSTDISQKGELHINESINEVLRTVTR